jgi:tetratricopeptide (TPR) repeat protein
LEVLDQAEALFGPNCALDAERRGHEAALGITPARARPAPAPRTAREHYAVGRALFRAGDLAAAEARLDRALELQPGALWPTFYKGACAYRRARYEDAVLAFTACAALAPRSGWCYHNRGLAYEALGQPERALSDYDRALRLGPASAPAALSRARLHCRAGRYPRALEDLARAEANGAAPALVEHNRALVHLARGDRAAALACLDKALDQDPRLEEARRLADRLRRRP